MTLRIGIIGARGIGKHHAKWYTRCGCKVTAVYGTTEATAAAAAASLRETCGFSGRAFHDWAAFRREGGFDACSVCSPAEAHFANVRDLAADGKHLLCEKPLVWNWSCEPRQLTEDAAALVEAAARHGVLLGMNAQYPAALPGWVELHRRVLAREPEYRTLSFVMAGRGKARSSHGAAETWVDLGPHPLAFMDALGPGRVDGETVRHRDGPAEAVLDFQWVAPACRWEVHVETLRTSDGPVRRCFGNQDLMVEYETCMIDGEFAVRLRAGDAEWTGNDLMHTSVERFVEAVRTGDERRLLVDGAAALRQQRALVEVWERCWASGRASTGQRSS